MWRAAVRRSIMYNVIFHKETREKVYKNNSASSLVHDNSHPHPESSRCQL